jgi:(p)ppGpp synthase/HD superfamily hydrolase
MVYEESLSHGLPPVVSVASFLHDILEDTTVTYDDLINEFGSKELADIVECVTDEPGDTRKEKKAATYPKIRSNPNAIALKLCDRISNVKACLEENKLELVRMYQEEHPEFEAQLKVEGMYPSLWAELDRVIK